MQTMKDEEGEDVKILQEGMKLNVLKDSKLKTWRYWISKCTSLLHFTEDEDKTSFRHQLNVADISEVRSGCRTDDLNEVQEVLRSSDAQANKAFEAKCFSIHAGVEGEIIHSVIALSEEDASRWVKGLRKLIERCELAKHQSRCDPRYWLKFIFREADTRNVGFLNLAQCKALLQQRLNVVMDDQKIKQFYAAANVHPHKHEGREDVLDEEEFFRFFQMISHRPALDSLFEELGGDISKTISAEKLLDFLTNTQCVPAMDLNKVNELIRLHDRLPDDSASSQQSPSMTIAGFRALMISDIFDIRKEEHRQVNQPMDRPLSHYWMKSSHNTYLLTGQLVGKSSIEGFRKAIAKHCACIELDLWNGPDGEPIVTHGGTLVSKIRARDVLEDGILPFVFTSDKYPLILSLEDHMSAEQRRVFIRHFLDILGDYVYARDAQDMAFLPSPEQLKRKIIIKASKEKWGNLANICQAVHFPHDALDEDGQKRPVYQLSSLSEHAINNILHPSIMEKLLCQREAAEQRRNRLREFTARQQIRTYPGGRRVLSGNYDAIEVMNAGVQIAAMNVQTKCSNLAIYEGRFRSNGDCAFVLKPGFLLNPNAPRVNPKRVTVSVISAQNLPPLPGQYTSVNPYVTIQISGVESDQCEKSTDIVEGNGLNPVWNKEFTFDVMEPELAIILFSVRHSKNSWKICTQTVAVFALPVLSLASGYRHVPLQDRHMVRLPLATLFVKVSIQDR